MNDYTKDTLLQQTTAEYMKEQFRLEIDLRLQQRVIRTGQLAGLQLRPRKA